MAGGLPRQDVSEAEKIRNDYAWYKQYIDHVVIRHAQTSKQRIDLSNRMDNEYNGLVDDARFIQYNNTYGADKTNLAKYIDYRLCRSNLDLFVGEELESPINGTVYTTNPEAHVQQLEHVSAIVGLHVAKPVLDNLKKNTGVNIFDGMEPPEVPQDKTIFETLAPKSKNEMIMQLILNRQIPDMGLKLKFSENVADVTMISECFGKTDIDADGNPKYRTILPKNAIFEESERDPFLENTPYIGEVRSMFVHDILREFKLTKEEADKLESYAGLESIDGSYRNNYEMINGQLCAFVYSIEWKGFESTYIKTTKKDDGEVIEAIISPEYYEANVDKIKYEVEKGRYKIDVKYKTVLYQADRIGHEIYKNLGKVKNTPFSMSKPAWTEFHYTGLLFNTRNGVRVSIKQLTEHIDRCYNEVMWQIRRELAKAKGKVMVYDLSLLPKNGKKTSTPKQIMYDATNDGIIYINTSADGNASGRDAMNATGFTSIDMGVSNTVSILIPLKDNLERMADRITGIDPSRRGNIKASATVANTDTSIAKSTTTTAALTYFFYQYKERVIRRVLDMTKISWGILKPEKGEMILGTEGMQYLKATHDIAFDDYGYTLADSRKEQNIREIVRSYFQQSINAGTGRIQDAIEFETAETMTEALAVIKKGWQEVRKAQAEDAKAAQEQQAQLQIQLQQGQGQMQAAQGEQMAKEIGLRAQADIAKDTVKAGNQLALEQSQPQKR